MTVLDRGELEESPLADLHVIADQIGLEGYRRLRKADLIDAILADRGAPSSEGRADSEGSSRRRPRSRRARPNRGSRSNGEGALEELNGEDREESISDEHRESAKAGRERRGASEQTGEGIVEILGNGSAFLRVSGPEPSDEDVYISAAQVRRCELVSGDRVSGPIRSPRRSERYPSLIRVETINGEPTESVSKGARYEDMPVSWPSEPIELNGEDPALKAISSLAPFGLGSRALIVGAARTGKTELLRRVLGALAGREGLETMLVLSGVRPEEIAEWQALIQPVATLDFAASADAQGNAVENAVENGKRIAARGGNAVVLIDGLDGLHPHTARRVLAAARNLTNAGSLTLIATAARPFGGETTVIALDAQEASARSVAAIDPIASGTLKPEMLVGEKEA